MREANLGGDRRARSDRRINGRGSTAAANFSSSTSAVADLGDDLRSNLSLSNYLDTHITEDATAPMRIRWPPLKRRFVIEPGSGAKRYWRDLWRYRELLYILAWRDVVVRYKQTAIGVAWAVLRPALTLLVFLMFRHLGGFEAYGLAPEEVLVLAAVLPWQLFSTALSECSASLIENGNLISKVYFPRLLIPAAAAVTALVEFAITLGMLLVLMLWYGMPLGWQLLTLPLFVLLALSTAFGLGAFLAAMNVRYRDFRYIVPFCIQFTLFISPVAFTTTDVPERWRTLYALNPLAGIIDGFRWGIFSGRSPLDLHVGGLSVLVAVSFLLFGTWYFRRAERSFADVI